MLSQIFKYELYDVNKFHLYKKILMELQIVFVENIGR